MQEKGPVNGVVNVYDSAKQVEDQARERQSKSRAKRSVWEAQSASSRERPGKIINSEPHKWASDGEAGKRVSGWKREASTEKMV